MLIKKPADIRPYEITDRQVYLKRREFMRGAGLALGSLAAGALSLPALAGYADHGRRKLQYANSRDLAGGEALTPFDDVTTYNNFYEFGTDKYSPAKYAHTLKVEPWSVRVEGAVNKPGVYQLEDILGKHPLEERVYRLRCVEGWSMVIPWVGFPLA
ncbi:MAG: mononuclear molybdenum enzyme YedY, partial [Pseudomonadota bacterium]